MMVRDTESIDLRAERRVLLEESWRRGDVEGKRRMCDAEWGDFSISDGYKFRDKATSISGFSHKNGARAKSVERGEKENGKWERERRKTRGDGLDGDRGQGRGQAGEKKARRDETRREMTREIGHKCK